MMIFPLDNIFIQFKRSQFERTAFRIYISIVSHTVYGSASMSHWLFLHTEYRQVTACTNERRGYYAR